MHFSKNETQKYQKKSIQQLNNTKAGCICKYTEHHHMYQRNTKSHINNAHKQK